MQPIVNAIRNTGADNVIWVPSLGWQGESQGFAQYPISGSNVGYAAHLYPGYGSVHDNVTAVQNLWNSNYKPAADLKPMLITEMMWFPNAPGGYDDLFNGTTAGFGNAVKSAIENQGNVSYLVGFLGDNLYNLVTSTPANCTLGSGQGVQASFGWWITYTWAAPTGSAGTGGGGSGVTFYQNTGFGGAASQSIAAGNYTTAQLAALGVPDNWASSVQIPSGWTVTMYANNNLSGTAWTLTSSVSDFFTLSPSANDQMSSCTISSGGSGVTFYQDFNYAGAASQVIPVGNYTLSQLAARGVPNDWASSVRIPVGRTVIMYQHDNFTGTSWTRTADTPNFGSLSPSANDQMSSCRVQ